MKGQERLKALRGFGDGWMGCGKALRQGRFSPTALAVGHIHCHDTIYASKDLRDGQNVDSGNAYNL